jgi:hypothetical protein
MDKCAACGATLLAAATWCAQCFEPVAAPAPSPVSPTRHGPVAPPARVDRATRTTRWAKTDTTFGPVGRLVATVGLLAPLAVMIVGGLVDPFVWGGAAVWGFVITPWGLRDVWKAGRLASA